LLLTDRVGWHRLTTSSDDESQFGSAVLERLAAHWDAGSLAGATLLGGGYHNVLLRAGAVVIRIERRPSESVAWEHELLRWLAAEIPEVVAPIPAADGSTFLIHADLVVSLIPFVHGSHQRIADGAELLARVHLRGQAWPNARPRLGRPAYADLDWFENDWWKWSLVPKPAELVRAFGRTREWIESRPRLALTPIHGDIAPQNLLVRERRIRGIIDWEYARLDWPALELANAAWTLAPDDISGFIETYRSAGGPGEPDVLDEGIRVRLLANTLYSLTAAAEGRAWSRTWVDHLLAALRELP
jgi:Ser/Thr protein kinase RdoA (MazF antagonist)